MSFNPNVGRADSEDCDADADQRAIVTTIMGMPFAGLISSTHLPVVGKIDELFMDELARWLRLYRGVIQRQADQFTRMTAERNQLIDQRDAVRSFFGTMEVAE